MQGDFSRIAFKPKKHFDNVRLQQGRLILDTEWNEQMDITAHRTETEAIDTIGRHGGSIDRDGFHILGEYDDLTKKEIEGLANKDKKGLEELKSFKTNLLQGGDFYITPGCYYVDGILCENEFLLKYTNQPDLPGQEPIKFENNKKYMVYLDVWKRHISHVEDPDIREVALGGPDTATRIKTVWQVKAKDISQEKDPNCITCKDLLKKLPSLGGGKLSIKFAEAHNEEGLCKIALREGYQGLDNHLYRVEIHDGGQLYTWPRPQNFTAASVAIQDVSKVKIQDDGNWTMEGMPWRVGQVIEVFGDVTNTNNKPGILTRISKVSPDTKTITLDKDISSVGQNPQIRRVATFKWSRDNGSAAFAIELEGLISVDIPDSTKIKFKSKEDWIRWGPWQNGQEIEIFGNAVEKLRAKINNVVDAEMMLVIDKDISSMKDRKPRIRRSSDPRKVNLRNTRHASARSLDSSDYIEVLGDRTELRCEPGTLAKVDIIDNQELTLSEDVSDHFDEDHLKVRVWDQKGLAIAVTSEPIPLEKGIEIEFSGKDFRPGDYWSFCARTIGGKVEELENEPPKGIEHHYCPLAVIYQNADTGKKEVQDCRRLFPSLTGLINFFYVGGGGQEAMPGEDLGNPLQVGVSNWRWPVEGAHVRFETVNSKGEVVNNEGKVDHSDVYTKPNGIAECTWTLDANRNNKNQIVKATLLENDKEVGLPIYFNANLSIAEEVSYDSKGCENLGKTVKDAIYRLSRVASLHYVSGDNQEAMPKYPQDSIQLSDDLVVKVVNECGPVQDAEVQFAASDGGQVNQNSARTDPNGEARCKWALKNDSSKPRQSLTVTLIGPPSLIIHSKMNEVRFTAKLSIAEKVAYNPKSCHNWNNIINVQAAIDKLCEMTGDEDCIHIGAVLASKGGKWDYLANNDTIALDVLQRGIWISFDNDVNIKDSFGDQKPTCMVTIDLPFPIGSYKPIGFQPLILACDIEEDDRSSIIWKPKEGLDELKKPGLWNDEIRKLLAHLTLKGNFIWSGNAGRSRKYLDGEAFAIDDQENKLDFSGDRRRGGDFEMWFWLEKPRQ